MKQKIIFYFLSFLLAFIAIAETQAAVNISPSSVNVARGQGNTVALTYQFSGYPGTTVFNSAEGVFWGGSELGRVNFPLTALLTGGRGIVTETLVIPAAIAERAIQQGSVRFIYRRVFHSSTGAMLTTSVSMTVTGESIGQFGIKRINLYFENGRAEITVKKNQKDLKATADISFIGSGLFKGYWEVDGRVLSQVNMPLMSGQSITLTTPEIPPLPTFETGTHTVRFVVTSPAQGIPLPSLVYFVTAEESAERFIALKLKSPADKAELPYAPVLFQWEEFASTLYLIQFYENTDSKPVFSAYTRKPNYKLPDVALKSTFRTGKVYYWKVTGFDKQKRRMGESQTARFSFK